MDNSSVVAGVRAFSRFYTRVIGLLDGAILSTRHTLAEARVLFELAQVRSVEVADLRATLDVDAGNLSRVLNRLGEEGLVERSTSPTDRRRLTVALTASGREAGAVLDQRSAAQVGVLVADLGAEDRERLSAAMVTVQDLLGDDPRGPVVVLRPPRPGDWGWVVATHGERYAAEHAWDETFEALVARVVGDELVDWDHRREAAWIAEVDGRRAGCVLCVRKDDETAQLRLLLVEPWARGQGLGGRLVDECLAFARGAGYRRMTLWTNDVLADARRVYERAGFTLDDEAPHHAFGHDLVEQNWSRDL